MALKIWIFKTSFLGTIKAALYSIYKAAFVRMKKTEFLPLLFYKNKNKLFRSFPLRFIADLSLFVLAVIGLLVLSLCFDVMDEDVVPLLQ